MADEKEIGVDERGQAIEGQIKKALEDKEIPNIYFNGFITTVGIGDAMLVLTQNNEPVAILNMSYTLAKTLAQKVGGGIATLEQKSGNTIMATDDIKRFLAEELQNDVTVLEDNDEAE